LAAFLAAGVFLLASTSAARAADPFYQNLLRDGAIAFEQKNYQEAELNLRLACFGLLDDLELLPEGLTRLALAQEAAGKTEDFRQTFRQILEIEERFQAYSEHPPEPALKALFEAQLAAHVSETLLGSGPTFEGVRRRKVLDRLARLSKGEPAQALEALIAASPEERLWRMRRADLALDEGSPQQAVPHLDALLTQNPKDDEARCLRGQALVLNRCPEAVADLMSCPQRTQAPRMAFDFADCLVEMGDLEGASQFLVSLEGQARTDRAVSKLQRRVEKDLKRQRKQAAAASQALAAESLNGEAPNGEAPSDVVPDEVAPSGTIPQTSAPQTSTPQPSTPQITLPPAEAPDPEPGQETAQETQGERGQVPAPQPQSSSPPPALPESRSPAEPRPLTRAQQEKLTDARNRLTNAQRASDLEPALAAAKKVADERKDVPEAQHLAGEIAYRSSKWNEAAKYFRRGGDASNLRPNLLFFMAVSFYETGDLAAAREALERCLPKLQKTDFVEAYRRKIQE